MRIIKYLSLIIIICMAVVPFSYAKADTYEKVFSKLESLGILDIDSDKPTASMTRGEFAFWLAAVIKQNDSTYSGELFFKDIAVDEPYFGSVYSMYKLGVVALADSFRPDDTIKYEEAVKMLVSLLGYSVYAEARGGFPSGYFSVSQTRDISISKEYIYADGSITREQGAYLLTKAVEIPILKQVGFGAEATYEAKPNITILSEYHDIFKTRGVVKSIGTKSLYVNNTLTPDKLEMNDTIFENAFGAGADCLGAAITAYYKDRIDMMPVLLYAQKEEDSRLIVDRRDIKGFNNGVINYEISNGSMKNVSIPVDANLLYNYRYTDTYSASDILNATRVEFFSSTGGTNYDTVNIINSETIVVSGVRNDKIYGKKGEIIELNTISGYNYFSFYDKDGNKGFLTDINEWTVLSVIRDRENIYSDIYISNETVTGVIEEIYEDDGETVYVVDNISYRLSKDTLTPAVMLAQNVAIYLNIYGEIAAMTAKKGDGNLKYGYLVDFKASEKLDANDSVLIFTEDSALTKFFLDDNFRIKGAGKLSGTDIEYRIKLNNNGDLRQLINYFVSEEGHIKEITLAEKISNEEDLLLERANLTRYNNLISNDSVSYPYNKEFSAFTGKMRINTDTLIMFVPENEKYFNDETRYAIEKPSLLRSAAYSYVEVYNLAPDRTAGVIVIRQDEGNGISLKSNTAVTIVSKIAQSADEDGKVRTKIYGYRNKLSCEFFLADGVSLTKYYQGENKTKLESTVEVGDLIRTAVNNAGEIIDYYKVFSAKNKDDATYVRRGNEYENTAKDYLGSTMTMVQYNGNAAKLTDDFSDCTDILSGRVSHGKDTYWYPLYPFSLEFGIAKERYNNEVIVTNISGEVKSGAMTYTLAERYLNMNNRPVYVYDETKNSLETGSLDDLIVSDNAGVKNASRIVYARYEDVPSFILIVKRK